MKLAAMKQQTHEEKKKLFIADVNVCCVVIII